MTRTCQEPEVIIQSDPVKNCGSSLSALRQVRHRGELCAGTGERRRHDVDNVNIIGGAAHFDLRDARDDRGGADGDQQVVRAGLAFVENIRAAYMGPGAGGRQQEENG